MSQLLSGDRLGTNGMDRSIVARTTGDTGSRKLMIKNFREKPKTPENLYFDSWKVLKEAVLAVFSSRSIAHTLEDLYRAVENVCTCDMAHRLYTDLLTICEEQVRDVILPQLDTDACTFGGDQYLKTVANLWDTHCRQMLMIRGIFLFLDRKFVLYHSHLQSIWDMGMTNFRRHVMALLSIQKRVVDGMLEMIVQERSHELINRHLLQSLVSMFITLQLYKEVFEVQFFEATVDFYKKEAMDAVHNLKVSEYLHLVNQRLKEESLRVEHYIHTSSRSSLIHIVEEQMLKRYIAEILQRGSALLLGQHRLDDLTLLFNLLDRVDEENVSLRGSVQAYVKNTALEIIKNDSNDVEKDKEMIQKLLDLRNKMDDILDKCFQRREMFVRSVQESFESAINSRQNKPAEYIAKYVDSALKSGNKSATEEELDRTMDKIMVLFRYIHGKDVFEAFYKKDLAKRLLFGKSASSDAEKAMLSKLKSECGPGYTAKLEGMFKDVELSKDINQKFRETHGPIEGIDIAVNVITQGFWPTYQPQELIFPSYILRIQEAFKDFYLQKHTGRRLQYLSSLGTCALKGKLLDGQMKELHLSQFQGLILLQFNEQDYVTYQEFKQATGMEVQDLKRTLQSLSVGKGQKILVKSNKKTTNVGDDERFCLNKGFTHRLFRIKFNHIQFKETKEEQEATHERVFQDRQYQVDAAIVRIMKTRKTLAHNMLMTELFEILKFPIQMSDIKKRVESLIDRDYIKRDTAPNVYNYVA